MDVTIKENITKHKNVLNSVKTIVKHHRQLTQAKGELFNIYNILGLKTNEVRTHSAFIAELLKPNGTHLMGNLFLKAFLKLLPEEILNHLNTDFTTVYVEFYIGIVDIVNKKGGRIDILIKDSNGKTISIENKIDAGLQDAQIERYCNYNKANNIVLYLTKFGDIPTPFDEDNFEDKKLYIISYQNHIIKWLENCQTIASDQPILRESIKQYKILIQEITNTLGDKQDKELEKIVVENLNEASLIASKYNQVIIEIKEDFRKKIITFLEPQISEFTIKSQGSINSSYASIWFNNPIVDNRETWIGIESFSGLGHLNGALFIGILDKKGVLGLSSENYNRLNKMWVHHEVLMFNNVPINISDKDFLQKLYSAEKLEYIAKEVSNQIIRFIDKNKHLVS